jgi:hypothetical protein
MKTFWQSILAAVIGGALSGAAQGLATGSTKGIGWTAAAGAATAAGSLLKQSPIKR